MNYELLLKIMFIYIVVANVILVTLLYKYRKIPGWLLLVMIIVAAPLLGMAFILEIIKDKLKERKQE